MTDGTDSGDFVGAVLGLVATLGGLAVLYPMLPAADHPLAFLAVTAAVGLLVVGWVTLWTCIGIVRSRHAAGPNGS